MICSIKSSAGPRKVRRHDMQHLFIQKGQIWTIVKECDKRIGYQYPLQKQCNLFSTKCHFSCHSSLFWDRNSRARMQGSFVNLFSWLSRQSDGIIHLNISEMQWRYSTEICILTLKSKGWKLHGKVLLNRKASMENITFHLKEELISCDFLRQFTRIRSVELDSEV